MPPRPEVTRVAVVQVGSVLLDVEASLRRLEDSLREAASRGARVVVFPEAFLPGYPRGMSFGAVVGQRTLAGREEWRRLHESSVVVPGPITESLGALCTELDVVLVLGVIEREAHRAGGTLYCTLVTIGADGRLLNCHRKLKPTGTERLIWGEGDASGLRAVETDRGRIGGLICWENYMPLARTALYADGVEIYCAATADARETWQATLRHIAVEGRCFVLGCNQFMDRSMLPAEWAEHPEIRSLPEVLCRGGSAIYSPLGECLAGPLFDSEGILMADLDLREVVRGKFDLDAVGHYARPDLFRLEVDRRSKASVDLVD